MDDKTRLLVDARLYFVQLLVIATEILKEFQESKATNLEKWFEETQVCHCGECHIVPRIITHEILQYMVNDVEFDAIQERKWVDQIELIMPELIDNEPHNQ